MQYTNEELAIRLWDTEHIRHTMNRMCYYLSNRDFRGLINDLWVQKNKRTASLGYNNGYYIGMDEIVRHLVLEQTDLPKTGSARMETLTEIFAADKSKKEWLGFNRIFESNLRKTGEW